MSDCLAFRDPTPCQGRHLAVPRHDGAVLVRTRHEPDARTAMLIAA